MDRPPRLLLLAASDASRLDLALQEGGVVPASAVTTADAFAEALGGGGWDVVVVSASALAPEAALAAVREAQPGLPVVVVAGEEADVEALGRAGAAAALTPADLRLLGAAVSRALRATRAPAPPPAAPLLPMPLVPVAAAPPAVLTPDANAVQALAEHLPIGLYQTTPDGRLLFANEALAGVLGLASVAELGRLDVRHDLGYPRDHFVEQVRLRGAVRNLVVRWTDRAGRTKYTRENARAVCGADGAVLYYEGTMEDVTAECEAREREQRRTEQLGAIVRFAAAVDPASTADAVYRAAVEAVVASMGTPHAMLLARRGEETRCVAWSEALPDTVVAVFRALRLGELLPLHACPLLLRDERAEGAEAQGGVPDPLRAMMRTHGLRALGSFPLVHHGHAHGAFVVLYPEPHPFAEEEVRVAETLAWHVAGSLARQHAESSLRDSEACLRFLAENTTHVLYRLRYAAEDAPGGFDYLSPAVEALTGYTADDLEALGGLGRLVEGREVFEGHGLTEGAPEVEGERHYLALYRMRTKGGEPRWVENNAYLWYDDAGQAVGLVGVLQDVSERKRRENAQAAEAARTLCQQKALVELSGLHAAAPDAVIRRATELVAACTGAARVGVWTEDAAQEVLCCRDLVAGPEGAHGTEPPLPLEAVGAVLTRLDENRVFAAEDVEESALIAQGGAAEPLRAYLRARGVRAVLVAPIRLSGRVTGVVVLSHVAEPYAWGAAEQDFAAAVADLLALAFERAERQAAEAARRESEARNRAISELASDYAFALHFDAGGAGRLAWATDAFARVTGYDPAEVAALRDLLGIVHPESRDAALGLLHALGEGEDADLELRIVTKAGEDRWVRHRARRLMSEAAGVVLYHSGQDVTERKRFERELIAAREAAEELARVKSAFLANMSHEIRTPLTGILGYAGLLAEEVEGEQREFVEFIERSGRRLLDTLNSVLELARLEASGVEPRLEWLDVAAEARQAVRLLAPLAESKGLALVLEVPEAPVVACLDRVCLGRILTNLIGNAIKFTDEGRVHVAVEAGDAGVAVRVCDTGCGIAAAFLPHLFDEFKQESEGHARSHEGAGLGLAITKRLTDLLGGAIAVESTRPGGSTFTVSFPRRPTPSGDGASAEVSEAPLVLPVDVADDAPYDSVLAPDAFIPDAFEPDPSGDGRAFVGEAGPGAAEPDADPPVQLVVAVEEAPERSAGPPLEGTAATEAGEIEVAPPAVEAEAVPSGSGFFVETDLSRTLDPSDLAPGAPGAPPQAAQAAQAAPELDAHGAEAVFDEAETFAIEIADGAVPIGYTFVFAPDHESARPEALPARSPDDSSLTETIDDTLDEVLDEVPPGEGLSAPAWDAAALAHERPGEGASDPGARALPTPPPSEVPPPEAAPVEQREEGPPMDAPAVLVVEDNEDTRALLHHLLRRAYRVCVVPDALTALDRMNRYRFDALVLDINLGGKQTGVDVLRVARTIPGYASVFAVALTAYALPGDRERFLAAGFDRYVAKPFTGSVLMAALGEGMPAA
jgi:PAS domain S-box-containing protein